MRKTPQNILRARLLSTKGVRRWLTTMFTRMTTTASRPVSKLSKKCSSVHRPWKIKCSADGIVMPRNRSERTASISYKVCNDQIFHFCLPDTPCHMKGLLCSRIDKILLKDRRGPSTKTPRISDGILTVFPTSVVHQAAKYISTEIEKT